MNARGAGAFRRRRDDGGRDRPVLALGGGRVCGSGPGRPGQLVQHLSSAQHRSGWTTQSEAIFAYASSFVEKEYGSQNDAIVDRAVLFSLLLLGVVQECTFRFPIV
ncbi:hypothetical protein NDU88_001953 [Pleurodeles waltl]|uniref:Uncharacterized protein n=1 Tax=Pleurodeles waltl TaxID=8319 RepID=A0AAV7Q8I7_PLEWA|nr:hypothetical protein NDU88_001953 [Pleurodeles waltl]